MFSSQTFDATYALGPARRSLGVHRVARSMVRGAMWGSIAALAAVALGYVLDFRGSLIVGLALMIVGLAAGLIWGIRSWPTNEEAARAIDRHFRLADRVTTAVNLALLDTPIARLQREDARERIAGLPLRQSTGWEIRMREIALCVVTVGMAVTLALHMPAVKAAPITRAPVPNADAQRIRRAAIIEVPALIRQLEQGLPQQQRQDPSIKALTAHLAALRQQLLQSSTRHQALRAISLTQLQLQQMAAHLRPISSGAISQLSRSLGQLQPKAPATTGSIDNSSDASAAARTLQQLAAALAHMNKAQRAQLARALERASNSASDVRLRDALHRAASALGYNDPRAAQRYLQQAANLLGSAPAQRTKQNAFKRADTSLQHLKNRLTVAPPKAGSRSGQSTGRTPGSTNANRQGTENRSGSSQSGRPATARNGSTVAVNRKNTGRTSGLVEGSGAIKAGRVTGGQTRVSGQGGHVTSDSQTGSTNRGQGRFAKVFVPGKQGTGPHVTQSGANSAPHQVQFIPYRQVVASYASTARSALEHSNLAPDVRAYVRQYFVAISH